MIQDVYIIEDEDNLIKVAQEAFQKKLEYKFKKIPTKKLELALKNIPSLIIINEDLITDDVINICNKIKENDDNSITPIIVVSSNIDKKHRLSILKACVEHYIIAPIDKDYFYYTIINILKLLDINRRVSPLTGLPRQCSNSNRNEKAFTKSRRICNDIF